MNPKPETLNRRSNVASVSRQPVSGEGLWASVEGGERAVLAPLTPSLVAALPVEDTLGIHHPRGGTWPSCAVVANTAKLRARGRGAKP